MKASVIDTSNFPTCNASTRRCRRLAAFSDTNCRTSRFTAFWALPPVSLIDLEKNDGGWHHARSVATANADEDEAEEEEAEEEEAEE